MLYSAMSNVDWFILYTVLLPSIESTSLFTRAIKEAGIDIEVNPSYDMFSQLE